jgi:hypothetical protein
MKLTQLERVESELKYESYDLSKFLYNFILILYSKINFHIYYINSRKYVVCGSNT